MHWFTIGHGQLFQRVLSKIRDWLSIERDSTYEKNFDLWKMFQETIHSDCVDIARQKCVHQTTHRSACVNQMSTVLLFQFTARGGGCTVNKLYFLITIRRRSYSKEIFSLVCVCLRMGWGGAIPKWPLPMMQLNSLNSSSPHRHQACHSTPPPKPHPVSH